MGTDLYPTARNAYNLRRTQLDNGLWPVTSASKEIDLRTEFYRTLYGWRDEVAKGQIGLLRRMRTDSDGNLISCDCVDETTHEPDLDSPCSICGGEGFIWDEEWITYYAAAIGSHEGFGRKDRPIEPGVERVPYKFFYFEYFVEPTNNDRVVELVRDTEGNLATPYRRSAIFPISYAEPFRSDNGRIEYWRVACSMKSVKSVWQ